MKKLNEYSGVILLVVLGLLIFLAIKMNAVLINSQLGDEKRVKLYPEQNKITN